MSWGIELWDQFDNIAGHTQKGIDFCEKYSHFIKERCAIENEYAGKLKKLVKNYKPKKSDDEEFTCPRGFYRMLNELHDLAGQHESISECLNASVFRELQTLVSELKQDRRKCLQDGAKQHSSLKSSLEQMEKTKKQYEKAFKESEKSQENYKKADADIHLSRADVDKAKNLMINKQQNCEQCKNEYALELQKTNNQQKDHYDKQMPEIFSQLQNLEEKRVNTIQDFIKQSAEIERRTIPIINTCIDGIMNAAQSINATEDSKLVIERYKSGFTPPSDIPFEDLSNGNIAENHNSSGGTPKGSREGKGTIGGKGGKKERKGLMGFFGGNKSDESKDDYSHLPPNQQKKKLIEKIDGYRSDVARETASRDGMLKMRDVYAQNRSLGDPASLDKQLEANAQKLDNLRKEMQKYEGFLAEVENRNLQPNSARSTDSLSKRMSNTSLASTGQRGSNPGTPQQSHHSMISSPPDRDSRVELQTNDSFEDTVDDAEEIDDFDPVGTCQALYDFEAPNEGSIQMRAGEDFSVLEKDQGDGWTRVKRTSGEVGFVPTSYIRLTE